MATLQHIASLDCKLVVVERNNVFRDVVPEASVTEHQTTHFEHGCYVDVLSV